MITLHHSPGTASFAVHALLNEIGTPFELALIDRATEAHKQPAYLALNPNGLIPVLVDGDLVLYETVAILMHLADRFPDAALAPPLGSAERAHYYKWGFWLSNTLQAMLMHYFYPERMVDAGNSDGTAQVKRAAEARVGPMLDLLGAQFAHGQPWLLGERYSALDPMAFLMCRWTRGFAGRPARAVPALLPYLQRMVERPALRQTIAAEGLAEPWF